MNFNAASTSTLAIPEKLEALGNMIQSASDQKINRNDFTLWFNDWHKEASSLIRNSSSSLLALEQEALESKNTDIVEREAVKDAIELEQIVKSIASNVDELAKGLSMELKTGHIWKCWACKIKPLQSKLELSIRKFRIAISGL